MSQIVVARLNDRAQPLDRGELYEDPLDHVLKRAGLGAVTGGGTLLGANGEIELCEVEIELEEVTPKSLELVTALLERLGAPKGSQLVVDGGAREIPFGATEGLGVYLNGTDLPDEVYRTSDVNVVYEEFGRRLEGIGKVHSHWQGPTETALYMYGNSYEAMTQALADFLASYPLCDRARLVRIA